MFPDSSGGPSILLPDASPSLARLALLDPGFWPNCGLVVWCCRAVRLRAQSVRLPRGGSQYLLGLDHGAFCRHRHGTRMRLRGVPRSVVSAAGRSSRVLYVKRARPSMYVQSI